MARRFWLASGPKVLAGRPGKFGWGELARSGSGGGVFGNGDSTRLFVGWPEAFLLKDLHCRRRSSFA